MREKAVTSLRNGPRQELSPIPRQSPGWSGSGRALSMQEQDISPRQSGVGVSALRLGEPSWLWQGHPLFPKIGVQSGSPPTQDIKRGRKTRKRGRVMSSVPTGDVSTRVVTEKPKGARRVFGPAALCRQRPQARGRPHRPSGGRATTGPRLLSPLPSCFPCSHRP